MKKVFKLITWPFKWWWHLGKKRWLVFLALLLIWIAYSIIKAKLNAGKPDFTKYEIYQVTGQTIKKKINREGKLYQQGVVPVIQAVSGLVSKVNLTNGRTVKKGEIIAVIESTATQEQKNLAWAKYMSAKAAANEAEISRLDKQKALEEARQQILDKAQTTLNMQARFMVGDVKNETADRPDKRYTDNEKESILSEEKTARKQFEIAEQEYLTIEDSIKAAKAELASAWWNYQSLNSATIKAPCDGIIANLAISEGDYVNLDENEPILQIISNPNWVAKLALYEREVQLVEPGNEASLQMLLNPDRIYEGIVNRVDSLGTEKITADDKKEITYSLVIKVTSSPVEAVSGSRVTVDIIFPEKSVTMAVPNAAIRYKDEKRYVQIYRNRKIEEQEVSVGLSDSNYSEVISGLNLNDPVLTFKSK